MPIHNCFFFKINRLCEAPNAIEGDERSPLNLKPSAADLQGETYTLVVGGGFAVVYACPSFSAEPYLTVFPTLTEVGFRPMVSPRSGGLAQSGTLLKSEA